MVHSSHPPPARAGTIARTHTNANTQLVHTDPGGANSKRPCAPWQMIYAHMESSSTIRWPLISFPQPDDSLPAGTVLLIISIHKQTPGWPKYTFSRATVREIYEHMCLLTGHGETECQLDLNRSDKTPAHFLFHKVQMNCVSFICSSPCTTINC